MKKTVLNIMAMVVAIVFAAPVAFAQVYEGTGFEGAIEFKKITTIDTTKYIYYIKGDMVRIDEIGSNKNVAGIMLVNTRTYKAKSLNPERKLYMDLESHNTKFVTIKEAMPAKGTEVKTITGYKCEEWNVTNKEQNTKITYYLAKGDFSFFEGLLIALNRKDKIATYYQQIPNVKNVFPFLAIEKDLNGQQRSRLEVVKVEKKTVNADMFEIPGEYKKFEK